MKITIKENDERILYTSWRQDIIDQAQSDGAAMVGLKVANSLSGAENMSKEHKSIKLEKKKPAMSPKEKKAAKKAKKAAKKTPRIV